jgi:hypothetical protein
MEQSKQYTPEQLEIKRERKIEKQHELIDDAIRDVQSQAFSLKHSYERQNVEVTCRKIKDFIDDIVKAYAKIDALEVDDDEVLDDY